MLRMKIHGPEDDINDIMINEDSGPEDDITDNMINDEDSWT